MPITRLPSSSPPAPPMTFTRAPVQHEFQYQEFRDPRRRIVTMAYEIQTHLFFMSSDQECREREDVLVVAYDGAREIAYIGRIEKAARESVLGAPRMGQPIVRYGLELRYEPRYILRIRDGQTEMLRAQTSMEITQFGALCAAQGKAIESDAGLRPPRPLSAPRDRDRRIPVSLRHRSGRRPDPRHSLSTDHRRPV